MIKHVSKNAADFRGDINALRAAAVIGVLLFHLKLPVLQGGFAGVDVFFVISGYLMTRIILKALDGDNFSYWDFIAKRVKRIIPALLAVITVFLVLGFFLYLPDDYKLAQRNASASLLFLSNVLYWKSTSSYFDTSSDTNVFLHTWSLSVEWQFYMIYPIILAGLTKLVKKRILLLYVLSGVTILIAAFSIFLSYSKPSAAFYLLPTRSWEMIAGGIAFLLEGNFKIERWKRPAAYLGYAIILISFLFLNDALMWPGIFTVLPVLGTFLVIIAKAEGLQLVDSSITQFFGKISYSLYLWHWPVYVVSQYFGLVLSPFNVVMLIALSIGLAVLSFQWIEQGRYETRKVSFAGAMLVIITAGFASISLNSGVFKSRAIEIAGYSASHEKEIDSQFARGSCFIAAGKDGFNYNSCLCFDDQKKNLLLLGDSHAAQLSQSLKEKLNKMNVNVLQATAAGVLPTLNGNLASISGRESLRKVIDFVYKDFIPSNHGNLDGVILCGNWASANYGSPKEIARGLTETRAYLKKYNLNCIIIGQSESYKIPYPTISALRYQFNLQGSAEGYLNRHCYKVDKELSELTTGYVSVINSTNFPGLDENGIPYMFDGNHVTKYGADKLLEKVMVNDVGAKFIQKLLPKELAGPERQSLLADKRNALGN